mmetsp:Transcript_46401/g.93660  ORF Transcript_46401/g.93660 Transcript_46401/m.93660 type:complete len:279 (+) Transcript_46401:71-907(+)
MVCSSEFDGECILIKLHGNCLRALANRIPEQVQGLSQAARFGKKRGLISSNTVKKLVQLDTACAWLRHATMSRSDRFAKVLASELEASCVFAEPVIHQEPVIPQEPAFRPLLAFQPPIILQEPVNQQEPVSQESVDAPKIQTDSHSTVIQHLLSGPAERIKVKRYSFCKRKVKHVSFSPDTVPHHEAGGEVISEKRGEVRRRCQDCDGDIFCEECDECIICDRCRCDDCDDMDSTLLERRAALFLDPRADEFSELSIHEALLSGLDGEDLWKHLYDER